MRGRASSGQSRICCVATTAVRIWQGDPAIHCAAASGLRAWTNEGCGIGRTGRQKKARTECLAVPAPEGKAEFLQTVASRYEKADGRSGSHPRKPFRLYP